MYENVIVLITLFIIIVWLMNEWLSDLIITNFIEVTSK
jgi:hypothetical protein